MGASCDSGASGSIGAGRACGVSGSGDRVAVKRRLAPKKSPLPVFASVSAAALASTVASKNTGPLHVMKTIPLQHNSIKVGEPVHVESVEESKKAKDVMAESRKGAEET